MHMAASHCIKESEHLETRITSYRACIRPHKQTKARSTNTLGMALWEAFDFLGLCIFVSVLHSVKPLFCDVSSCHTTPADIMAMTGYLTWTCTHDTLPYCVRHRHDTLCL